MDHLEGVGGSLPLETHPHSPWHTFTLSGSGSTPSSFLPGVCRLDTSLLTHEGTTRRGRRWRYQNSEMPNKIKDIEDTSRGQKLHGSSNKHQKYTLQGINISHLGKRKIIFKMPFFGDMLLPWRVVMPTPAWDIFFFQKPEARAPEVRTARWLPWRSRPTQRCDACVMAAVAWLSARSNGTSKKKTASLRESLWENCWILRIFDVNVNVVEIFGINSMTLLGFSFWALNSPNSSPSQLSQICRVIGPYIQVQYHAGNWLIRYEKQCDTK